MRGLIELEPVGAPHNLSLVRLSSAAATIYGWDKGLKVEGGNIVPKKGRTGHGLIGRSDFSNSTPQLTHGKARPVRFMNIPEKDRRLQKDRK